VTDDATPNPSSPSAPAGRAAAGTPGAATPDPDALRIFTIEVGAWLSILAAAAMGFGAAGAFGVAAFVDPSGLRGIQMLTESDDFSTRAAVLLYAAVAAAGVAGMFVPSKRLKGGTAVKVAIAAASALVVLAVASLFVVSALLSVVMGLAVGAVFAAVLSLVRNSRVKPWRSAGVASVLTLVTSYAAQLLGGAGAGHTVMPWLALLGALIVLAGVLLLIRAKPTDGIRLPDTGAHVLDRTGLARPATAVASAWPCHLLFATLGAVGVLAQPSVADLGFGQGGMSFILCAVLLGWAVGFETGPDFAPGMTRTRLTTFALLAAGVLTIATGLLTELSGRAVLSGGVAFLVGLGVRAQRYSFSRRIGALAGMGGAVVVTALGVVVEVPLSAHASWTVHPADLAYVLVGLVALVGGVIALFTFGPTGVRGLGIDVVHAFRVPAATGHAAASQSAPGAAADAEGNESSTERQAEQSSAEPASAHHAAAAGSAAGTPAAEVPAEGDPVETDASEHDPDATAPVPTLDGEQGDPGDRFGLAALGGAAGAAGAAASGGVDVDRGFFIAIEGGDGTGKSTQIHLLADALRDRGAREVVTTREPGGTEAGTKLRSVVLDGDGVTHRAEALVFAADRAHHVASLVRPVIERSGIVITDRYIDSSRAYQAAGRDLGDEEITALSRWATEGLQPDLTIVLDVNPAVARQRTSTRGDENHLDSLDSTFHTAVRRAFLDFAQAAPHRYAIVDAGRDIDTVAQQVLTVVLERMAQRAGPAEDAGAVGSEDETRVVASPSPRPSAVPIGKEAAPHGSEDETRVVPKVRPQAPAGQEAASREPARQEPVVDASEAPTTVQPAVGRPPVAPPPVEPPQVQEPTIERPKAASQARQSSRERLRAQAEIERRARERLRSQRDGDHRGSGGAGPR
jgi:dTMP kinase